MSDPRLSDFENAVMYNAMIGNLSPKVTDISGDTPIVACLDSEKVGDLFERVRACGGYATIYSLSEDGAVRVIACIKGECAICNSPTDMINEPPSANATVGAFIDYLALQEDGIMMSEPLPARIVKSYGQSELINA